jgi:hypothetical protein
VRVNADAPAFAPLGEQDARAGGVAVTVRVALLDDTPVQTTAIATVPALARTDDGAVAVKRELLE